MSWPRVVPSAIRLTLAAALAITLTTPVLAQPARLEIWLAGDPTDSGPAAWRVLRHELLRDLPDWPRTVDPNRGVRIEIEWPCRLRVTQVASGSIAPAHYFEANLHIDGIGSLRGTGDFDGRETWRGHNLGPPRGRLLHLLRLAGSRGSDTVAVHGERFLAYLNANGRGERFAHRLLTRVASQGEVWHIRIASNRRGTATEYEITSPPSECGVLLPLVMALVADFVARPNVTDLLGGPVAHELDCWLAIATAGVGLQRAAAAEQLGRFDDPRARRTLQQLLTAHDASRLAAMRALAQMGAVEAAAKIRAAASPRIANSEATAAACLRSLGVGKPSAASSSSPIEPSSPAVLSSPIPSAAIAPRNQNPPTFDGWTLAAIVLLSVIATLATVIGWDLRRARSLRAVGTVGTVGTVPLRRTTPASTATSQPG